MLEHGILNYFHPILDKKYPPEDRELYLICLSHYVLLTYIPLRVGYHCYYTSPMRSRERVLITMITYECSEI